MAGIRRGRTSSKSLKLRRRAGAPLMPDVRLHLKTRTVRQVEAVVLLTVAALIALALAGKLSSFGDVISLVLTRLVGYGAMFVPVLLGVFALIITFLPDVRPTASKIVGLTIASAASLGLVHLSLGVTEIWVEAQRGTYGGLIGFTLNVLFRSAIGDVGTGVVLFAGLIIGLIITFEVSPLKVIRFAHWLTDEPAVEQPVVVRRSLSPDVAKMALSKGSTLTKDTKDDRDEIVVEKTAIPQVAKPQTAVANVPVAGPGLPKPGPVRFKTAWKALSLDLLSTASGEVQADESRIASTSQVIRETLLQFGVISNPEARGEPDLSTVDEPNGPFPLVDPKTKEPVGILPIHVQLGPTVSQFAFTPPEGVKLSKITALEKDFALKLRALSLRIEAPIPGQDKVGIELPNETRAAVGLREVLESHAFNAIGSNLRLPLGKNVSNVPVATDLKKMPHLLVAGTTGSGKSVMINAILISLLYQNSPDDLKLILVDPKRVELSIYNGIPHLLAPVITEPEKTVMALRWAVAEMTTRYKRLEAAGERNIDDYNRSHEDDKLPFIVIVIDELADLMLVAAKEVESAICRIAQMARAVGIHLIVATQRPSVDVVTGLIKANIPSRVAFTVASGIDSRTIIDTVGAEKLLGMGDMLFLDRNVGRLQRIQAPNITTKDIRRVVQEIKAQSEPVTYNDEILDPKGVGTITFTEEGRGGFEGDDPLEEDAITLILQTGKASASLLQRHLQVGYARAARILDILEGKGYIGPADGAKPRTILKGRPEADMPPEDE